MDSCRHEKTGNSRFLIVWRRGRDYSVLPCTPPLRGQLRCSKLFLTILSNPLLGFEIIFTISIKNRQKAGYFIEWRRGRDSNPRRARTLAGFQDQCIQPLCHLSDNFSFGNSRIGDDLDDYVASRPGGIDSHELGLALTPAGRLRFAAASKLAFASLSNPRRVLPLAAFQLQCIQLLQRLSDYFLTVFALCGAFGPLKSPNSSWNRPPGGRREQGYRIKNAT